MSKLQYFDYPGFGEWARENNHYSQVVRIGNELRVSGQGAWREDFTFPETEEEQFEVAWENVRKALSHAGLKNPYDNIISVRSYHVSNHYDSCGNFAKVLKKLFTKHRPLWTMLGVERLALKDMMVEIEVVAVIDED